METKSEYIRKIEPVFYGKSVEKDIFSETLTRGKALIAASSFKSITWVSLSLDFEWHFPH